MNKKELQNIIDEKPYLVWWRSNLESTWICCACEGGHFDLNDDDACLYEFCVINLMKWKF
jgi:hypothetical protein